MDHYPIAGSLHLQKRLHHLNSTVFKTPWLNFPHDSDSPACAFKDYPLNHGWTVEEVSALYSGGVWKDKLVEAVMVTGITRQFGEPLDIHPGGLPRPAEECLGMLQSWLLFGVLED